MILTKEERDKFATYLEASARDSYSMVKQMEKIHVPEVVIENMSKEIVAELLVANKLRQTVDG